MRWWDWPWLGLQIFLAGYPEPEGEPEPAPVSLRGLIAALLLLASLVLLSLHIIDVLRQSDRLQDCFLQGRTNCDAGPRATDH
ncbi:MAG TPA: hypothetical protein VL752_08900 [Acidisoma sp.]|uniref:hypothetical protein n=1 Tax=Acidisoma sp. TaxID=1872115 RepID=UPI002CE47303|nr:hypothetical protein [Acidisoma sp.]HTI01050.1 hypothetical protein [Acidisoma sp.]